METKIICPKCESKEIKKDGKRKTNRGLIQRYKCKECNYRFIQNDGFCKMTSSHD